ncbi:MAG: alpha/beta hydrolase [Chloroflexi bacterium]|uniref:Alpha/beta hydrolase n=1 Tax=Candidatus Chlorohelix allophototropha TaxID=3003348 RepID=A0A8T7M9C3_9CHLR|nr:alpha/beta hydrolase [Chloroflexota bacterium]WJW68581.1 alpha/beta hydrolase [Chloroflexota bacterium L227-S17]
MFNKQTNKKLHLFRKQADKKLHNWQKQTNKLIDSLEPEKKFNNAVHQVEKLPGMVGDFVGQLETEKKFNNAVHQVEKLPGMVGDFVGQLETEKKFNNAVHQVEKLPGMVGDFVSQLEPEKKLAEVKEQLTKMVEKQPAISEMKLPNNKLSAKAAKELKNFGAQAVVLNGKYEKPKKEKHFIRNTIGLTALTAAGLNWNNKRLWNNVPILESKLVGQGQNFISRWGQIFYKEAGNVENPPIVLVHGIGAGASSYEWRRNFEALAQDYHVYAYDLLGFGKSEHSPLISYTAELYINLMADFLRIVVKKPAGLVASSLSAGHAIQVAHRHPELVNALVLLEPSGINRAAGISGANVTGSYSYPFLRLPILGQGLFSFVASRFNIRSFMQNQLYYDTSQVKYELVEHYYIAAHQKGAEHAPLAFLAGKLNANFSSAFGKLQQPVVLVWGRESRITPIQEAYKLVQQLPKAELKILDDTRMACNDEKPFQFNQIVSELMSKSSLKNDNHTVLKDISATLG